MDSNEVTNNLLNRIVEGSTVTKAEMIEAIHANNKDILDKIESTSNALRTEMRADRRWLIGLFITAIVAVPALIKLLGHI
ncbi:hypothetical protein A0O36_00382 [Piscirickettsiaceae bacterium NZ-RLO1]|nr:hypothetical protein A0O36_00382 [Piscirickettsiaceae bacterium NZ-RLO1]